VCSQIFDTKFDIAAPRRRFTALHTICLASELVKRFQVFQRVRRRELSEHHIVGDLWTIYLMLLESDGLNERQLVSAGAFLFATECVRKYLGRCTTGV